MNEKQNPPSFELRRFLLSIPGTSTIICRNHSVFITTPCRCLRIDKGDYNTVCRCRHDVLELGSFVGHTASRMLFDEIRDGWDSIQSLFQSGP